MNLGELDPTLGTGFCCQSNGASNTPLKGVRPSHKSHSGNKYGTGLLGDPYPYGISDRDQEGHSRDILILLYLV